MTLKVDLWPPLACAHMGAPMPVACKRRTETERHRERLVGFLSHISGTFLKYWPSFSMVSPESRISESSTCFYICYTLAYCLRRVTRY